MAVRVAINGFGRIGRNVLRAIIESGGVHFGHFCFHWIRARPFHSKPSLPIPTP